MRRAIGIYLLILLGSGCTQTAENQQGNLSTQTNSTRFNEKSKKLTFLSKYVKSHSKVEDAEFTIFYQDNSSGAVAGPSDYTMVVAIKTEKNTVNQWISGFEKQGFQMNRKLWEKLPIQDWKLDGPSEVYRSGNNIKLIYPKSDVLLAYFTTVPFAIEKYQE